MLLKRQIGFTLLEVMIAVFILGVGLLGLAQLQITALKTNQSAEYKTQAIFLASDILDRIRANQKAIQNAVNPYSIDEEDDTPECDQDSPPENTKELPEFIASCDVNSWRTRVAAYLPNGSSSINCLDFDPSDEFAICTVTISWRDIQLDGSGYDMDDSIFSMQGAIGGQGPL